MFIKTERCIGCGKCAEDCVSDLIELQNGKAALKKGYCIRCGHCAAVCPVGAAEFADGSNEDILPYQQDKFSVPPENLLNFMKFRRSMRHYTDREVEPDVLMKILEAGRYAPTGANRQKTRYIILKERREEICARALKVLYDAAQRMEEGDQWLRMALPYRNKWIQMYEDMINHGKDSLFYHAPCVILTVTADPQGTGQLDAGLASAYMELMTNALGLGACFIGFFSWAVALEPTLRDSIGLRSRERLVSVMTVGYPDVRYYRTVERKAVNAEIL